MMLLWSCGLSSAQVTGHILFYSACNIVRYNIISIVKMLLIKMYACFQCFQQQIKNWNLGKAIIALNFCKKKAHNPRWRNSSVLNLRWSTFKEAQESEHKDLP